MVYICKYKGKTKLERFFMKVILPLSRDECWGWKGCKDDCGYGTINIDYIRYRAHRLSYFLFIGNPNGLEIMHTCDNPVCTNPLHLKAGSHQDNMNDMKSKNRQRSLAGEENKNAKLTSKQVKQIRELHVSGKYLQKEIAEMYNVNWRTISAITTRTSWKHI